MYQIDDSIRQMVTFMPLNLASDDYPSVATRTMGMDIILCRNVLIYFDNPTSASVIGKLERALCQDGWLVLGHAESAHIANQNFQPQSFESAVLFQKYVQPRPKLPSIAGATELRGYTLTALPQTRPLSFPTAKEYPVLVCDVDQSNVHDIQPQEDPFEAAQQAANREQWEEALVRLNEAEQKDKMCPQVHYLRGIVELQQGEIDKALKSLRQAIYCDSNFVLAYFLLGSIFEQEGQYKKALTQWSQALNLLRYLPPADMIPYSDGITVETLAAILEFRRGNLPIKL
jgi:chemotaxis protein methyltransferase CheR